MEKKVQNEPIHNANDGELKIKRRSVIDKDGLFWGKRRSTGGGGGGGSHDANNGVDDREKVLLISEGNPLFFGNRSEIMDYFQSIGFSPSVAMNPVDFLLDLANGISSDESSQDDQNAVKQKRGLKERRHKSFVVLNIAQVTVITLFYDLLWWQLDTNHIQDKSGLLFWYTDFSGFFPLFQAISTFPKNERCL
nr:ABC transporter G family member 9-like [Tanacetum cinerariifolium]